MQRLWRIKPERARGSARVARFEERVVCKIVCDITVSYFKIKNAWTSNPRPTLPSDVLQLHFDGFDGADGH
jgi:hypothetical protein